MSNITDYIFPILTNFPTTTLIFRKSLRKNGVIVIKCNVEPCDTTLYSTVTCSVIRPYWWYQKLFSKAGFRCFRNLKQKNIGYNPMPNYIFALRPV